MPFAGYKDFDDCVAKNGKKKDPKAYCAAIEQKVKEGMEVKARELLDVQEAEFTKDETTGKMSAKVAIIKAGRAIGKNRNYRASALQKAAKEGVYNNLRMFVDHSDKPPLKRGYREMVSAVESTYWDSDRRALMGEVTFFDEKFFEQTQRAKKYVGVSADHQIRVNYVQEGQQKIQDVVEIPYARSVDWVIYPAAGGEVLSFARESEGADQVEWNEVTLDQIKEHAPGLLDEFKKELTAREGSDPDPDPDPPQVLTAEQIQKMISDGITNGLKSAQESQAAKDAVRSQVRDRLSKSGLHSRVQDRLVRAFEGQTTYDEQAVDKMIEDAKEELKELGVSGPKISGMGMSGNSGDESPRSSMAVRESVESYFGVPKATDGKNASQ